MSHRAPFIVLEGPEGAGKSVQATLLANWLRQQGWRVVQTREPGGTPAGDSIRGILLHSDDLNLAPETEALLMSAARAQHVHEVITPALREGIAVISDRYMDSTYAYQGGGLQIPMSKLVPLQDFATNGVFPDIRLLLDLPVEVGLARRHNDAGNVNRIDLAPMQFHEGVRRAYLNLAHQDPDDWDIIDASNSVDAVSESIQAAVSRRLKGWPVPEMTDTEEASEQ